MDLTVIIQFTPPLLALGDLIMAGIVLNLILSIH